MNGAFIYREPQSPEPHRCSPPMHQSSKSCTPDAEWHDIWECDECKALWSVYGRGGNHWVHLGRYASWKARRKAQAA